MGKYTVESIGFQATLGERPEIAMDRPIIINYTTRCESDPEGLTNATLRHCRTSREQLLRAGYRI